MACKRLPPNYTINHNNKVMRNQLGRGGGRGIEQVLTAAVSLHLKAGILEATAAYSAEHFHFNGIEGQLGPRSEAGSGPRSWIEATSATSAEH